MADLTWSIEKIVDCKGNDITSGGWVTVSPTNGVGDTHASITVEPSTIYNDCETATITIATSTGEKKYVTINRCNPQCDCNSIEFNPLSEEQIGTISENGGTVPVASYSMKYGCTDAYMGIVNTKTGCDYNITNGTVYAIVDKNPSTTSDREFEYYVTYNGETCYDDESFQGSFVQNKSTDPCANEKKCPTVLNTVTKISYASTIVEYQIEDFTSCWNFIRVDEYTGYDDYELLSINENYATIRIGENDNLDDRKLMFTFVFENPYIENPNERRCYIDTDVITQGTKPVVNTCDNCSKINIHNIVPIILGPSIDKSNQTTTIATLNVDCFKDTNVVSFKKIGTGPDILDATKLYQSGGLTSIVCPTAYINDNTSYPNDINETIGIYVNGEKCDEFTITQEGTGYTPVVCTCEIDSVQIVTGIDESDYATINVNSLVDNDACESLTTKYGDLELSYIWGSALAERWVMLGTDLYPSLKTQNGLTFKIKKVQEGESITGTFRINIKSCGTKFSEIITIQQGCVINASCDYSEGGNLMGGLRYDVYDSGNNVITSYTLSNNDVIDKIVHIHIPEEYKDETFTVKAATTDSRYLRWNFNDATGVTCGNTAKIHIYKNVPINVKACISWTGETRICPDPTDYQILEPCAFKVNITTSSDSTTRKGVHFIVYFEIPVFTCYSRSDTTTIEGRWPFDQPQGTITATFNQQNPGTGFNWALRNGTKIKKITNFRVDNCETIVEHAKYYNRDTHEYYTLTFTENVTQECL